MFVGDGGDDGTVKGVALEKASFWKGLCLCSFGACLLRSLDLYPPA